MGELCQLTMGKTPPRGEQEYWSNPVYPWVSISDMVDGGIIDITKECVSEIAANKIFNTSLSPKGSLLMSFKLTIGKISILGTDSFHNEAIVTILPFVNDKRLKTLLFTFLPLLSQQGESKDAIKGKTLNSKSLYNILIPLPPLAEQFRIIERVTQLKSHLM